MKLFWIKRVVGGLLLAVIFVTAAGWAVSGLWNWLVPVLFAGPTITFVQALGLLLLSRILVGFRGGWGGRRWGGGGWGGGPYGHPRHAYWREKMSNRWQNMTPEERQQFKQQMKEQWKGGCGPRGFGRGRQHWGPEPQETEPGHPAEPTATKS
ncbi:hypothetical protein [Larkinella punicea]|uniref:hypothetical protein n=1 Tax=Larkinella punicea TaxID=2315727 RepID=UPI001CA40630|nr:hypothetical protein [Larkinella punicea]